MKLSQRLRKIWHDAFYRNATESMSSLALKCQDVTEAIDLHRKPVALSGHLRFWLHMSLCQACKNYFDLSKGLSKAVRESSAQPSVKLNDLNEKLIRKYSSRD